MAPIVGTLIIRSPERQVVGALIVRFSKHQQCNVNLNYLTSWVSAAWCKHAKERFDDGGSAASSMVKLAKV